MPTTDLKIRKVKAFNPQLKKFGFATRAIINGTETFDSVAEEASRNTTLNKYELAAALGIAAEQFARALKNGYAVDLGPIGKIYPTVSGKWTETAEEQTKSLLKKGLRYDASQDLKAAVEAMRLSWEKASGEEEIVEEEVVEEETDDETDTDSGTNTGGGSGTNNGGSGTTPERYTITYTHDGQVYTTQQYEVGASVTPPTPPEGYIWLNVPSVMPARNVFCESYEYGDPNEI